MTPTQRKANAEHIEARIRKAIRQRCENRKPEDPLTSWTPTVAHHIGLINQRQRDRLERIIKGEIQ